MEYVWGLHDFVREHEDEIDFKAGDRILVVEKDDLYQDEWWKGTNPAGQTGLFPMSYTTPHPPTDVVVPMAPASQILGSVPEESDSQGGDHEEPEALRTSGPTPGNTHRDTRALLAQNASRQNSKKVLQSHRPPIEVELAVFSHKDVSESPHSVSDMPVQPAVQEAINEETEDSLKQHDQQSTFVTPKLPVNGNLRNGTFTMVQPPLPAKKEESRAPTPIPGMPAEKSYIDKESIPPSTSLSAEQPISETTTITELPAQEPSQFSASKPVSSSSAKSLRNKRPSVSSFKPSHLSQEITHGPPVPPADISVDIGNFIEHEISGDVLLELDVNMLKELEIHALGKRMKIAHAINDLKNHLNRPISAISSNPSEHQLQGPSSLPHSVRSPSVMLYSPESAPHTGDLAASPSFALPVSASVPVHAGALAATELGGIPTEGRLIGLGVVTAETTKKSRPASLSLSPSDGALSAKGLWSAHSKKTSTSSAALSQVSDGVDKAATDTESAPTSLRSKAKKGFMRSVSRDQTAGLEGANAPSSPQKMPPASERRSNHKSKRSIDSATKTPSPSAEAQRLSFFSASLGKSRKPAPRYSESSQEISPTSAGHEKVSRGISRLYISGSTRKGRSGEGGRPSSAGKRRSSGDAEDKPRKILEVSPTEKPPANANGPVILKSDKSFLEQIEEFDHDGWMRKKGERYNTWKLRYFVLKGPHLYYLRGKGEAKIKGYINIKGYRIIADENIYPGRYGFRIVHDTGMTHYFSSDEQITIREWMKALMKATIARDYSKAVISSVNIPTIPLSVAQAMSPAPRPPSPTARDATQRALRRENTSQLSSRDAQVLMGLPSENGPSGAVSDITGDSTTLRGDGSTLGPSTPHVDRTPKTASAPARPTRRQVENSVKSIPVESPQDVELLKWVNSHLAGTKHRATDLSASLSTGLVLYRVAEHIKGTPYGSEVTDSAFPSSPTDEKLDGLFILFDFLLDNDVRMGSVSINDVRQGNHDKLVQLVKSLKSWEEKRQELERTIDKSTSGALYLGPFVGARS
ncbi:uncharacterized protein EI90DRAFT_3075110 [Cantharellus anzutake]|uniref:uncharacterized protein n=1 Tax=Cantharellus anzutake TaxID=1750568 RepID=UPI0019081120|nr:uncharacterized protein EI90DRAFT_3075110 [Cantharellus anzutake]KAF8324573.1 hypothetical protein EI90DRAFT_3075110 [Cantharellus anzutake]